MFSKVTESLTFDHQILICLSLGRAGERFGQATPLAKAVFDSEALKWS